MAEKYIEDYRNLKPYYDLVFKNMEEVSIYSYQRDIFKLTRAMRELIINTAPYIKKPKERLKEIEKELSKIIEDRAWNNNVSKNERIKFEEKKDKYIIFIHEMRIEIHEELTKTGFMPKTWIDDGKPSIAKYSK